MQCSGEKVTSVIHFNYREKTGTEKNIIVLNPVFLNDRLIRLKLKTFPHMPNIARF
jgi:hypothetical protein